jgi:hypothetical protein
MSDPAAGAVRCTAVHVRSETWYDADGRLDTDRTTRSVQVIGEVTGPVEPLNEAGLLTALFRPVTVRVTATGGRVRYRVNGPLLRKDGSDSQRDTTRVFWPEDIMPGWLADFAAAALAKIDALPS